MGAINGRWRAKNTSNSAIKYKIEICENLIYQIEESHVIDLAHFEIEGVLWPFSIGGIQCWIQRWYCDWKENDLTNNLQFSAALIRRLHCGRIKHLTSQQFLDRKSFDTYNRNLNTGLKTANPITWFTFHSIIFHASIIFHSKSF